MRVDHRQALIQKTPVSMLTGVFLCLFFGLNSLGCYLWLSLAFTRWLFPVNLAVFFGWGLFWLGPSLLGNSVLCGREVVQGLFVRLAVVNLMLY